VISAKNMSHSSHLEARDQLKQMFWDVRLKGIMGSHHHAHTNFEARPRLTGAQTRLAHGGRQSGEIRWYFRWRFARVVLAARKQRSRWRENVGFSRGRKRSLRDDLGQSLGGLLNFYYREAA
jgi:hypothetical protein